MQKENKNQYDVIVIGSGLGGLTTASLLAKINKKKVLVLERHYELGGLTHEFKRGAYSWDVGLHYVGNMKRFSTDFIAWFLFRFITKGKLKWNHMPKLFEKFIFPDLTIEIRESVKAYKKELLSKFPKSKKEINKYIFDIHAVRLWTLFNFFSKFFFPPLSNIFKLLSLICRKKALMTTGKYLNKYISDKRLRSVLVARWGNYGLPPMESAFAVHALIEYHYYSGGVFPDGGSEKIAAYIEETIEEHGGKILINREVKEIILEDKKAVGVRLVNLSQSEEDIKEYYAPIIISGAGVQNTFLRLLPNSLNLKIQKELKNFYHGYSALDIYIGLKDSPETLGIKGENYWIIDGYDLDLFDKKHLDILHGKPCFCFLSFPSLKSGKAGGYTADIVTIFPYKSFEKIEETYWKERPNDYYSLKENLTKSLLDLVEKNIPGFKELVVYSEMSTPLTFRHFTGNINGRIYGLPAVPERFKLAEIKVKTPIKNLYLTGTDILTNGITAALFSGMATASYLNWPLGILKILAKAIFYIPPKTKEITNYSQLIKKYSQSEDKAAAILIKKENLSNNMIGLTYKFSKKIKFLPGQHLKMLVGDGEWRAYSVSKVSNNSLTLMIDTRPGGFGSTYANKIKVNEETLFRLPITDLIYHETERELMFIATGTGLVPFIHILDELKQMNNKHKVTLLFGCLKDEDNFIDEHIKPYENFFSLKKVICVEKPDKNSPYFKGRVTDYLKEKKYDPKKYDFYICGHPHMLQDVKLFLRSSGADKIYW